MNKLLIGSLALSLVSASTALAQPYTSDQDHRDRGYQAGNDQGRQDRQDGGFRNDRMDRDHADHPVCTWRHHHRVCYRHHW